MVRRQGAGAYCKAGMGAVPFLGSSPFAFIKAASASMRFAAGFDSDSILIATGLLLSAAGDSFVESVSNFCFSAEEVCALASPALNIVGNARIRKLPKFAKIRLRLNIVTSPLV